MINYYKEEYYIKAKKQRKKCLTVYFVCLAVFLAVFAGLLAWYSSMPYLYYLIDLAKVICVITAFIFTLFSFIYLGIKFKRVNDYCKLCRNLQTGLKENFVAKFTGYDSDLCSKDGVDCKSLILSEWNRFKNDFYERRVYVFYEQDFPELEENVTYRFTTQGNFLLCFEQGEEK